MNAGLVAAILGALIRSLPEDFVKKGVASLLDTIDRAVEETPNKWDDNVELLTKALRQQLGIATSEVVSPAKASSEV